jgi:hypothetical protein
MLPGSKESVMFKSLKRSGRSTPAPRATVKPRLEELEDRRLMAAVTWNGGITIPNVSVDTIYWGSAWTAQGNNSEAAANATALNGFFSDITQSSYLNGLSQYWGLMPVAGVWIPTNPGPGRFGGADWVTSEPYDPNLREGFLLSESAITSMISSEIASGNVEAPSVNTLYFVYLPPGVQDLTDLQGNANGPYAGHHSSFTDGSGNTFFYAVIQYPTSGGIPGGSLGTESNFQYLTELSSHELVEAISNPQGNAWFDTSTGNEIGDITQQSPPPGGAMSLVDGYAVQKYWSQVDNTSIAPGGRDMVPSDGVFWQPPLFGGATAASGGATAAGPRSLDNFAPSSDPSSTLVLGKSGSDTEPTSTRAKVDAPDGLDAARAKLFASSDPSPDTSWAGAELRHWD